MEDSKIIELFYERSENAIIELGRKYGDTCKNIAVNILKNEPDAEECVNDTYLGAWNTIPPKRPDQLRSYICRITRNLAIKKYHKNTAEKRNSYYDVALDELEDCLASPSTVENELDANRLAELFDDFLDGLDKENRVMFVRRYWFSESISDIAARFGIGEHAVSARLLRIREKLRRYLSEKGVTI